MAKVTVTLYIEEDDKEALQELADAEDRSLSQMAVLILKKTLHKNQDEAKNRSTREHGRDDAPLKPSTVSDAPSKYRTNGSLQKPKSNLWTTPAYLEAHELQELAAKISELENAANGIDLRFKVQIELNAESQVSNETIARLNEILQEIAENLRLT
ncbi:MAG: hypothetical protein SAK29_07300 [Scytonema sp. PMC 1069.18]|nr:hypothetical protein [Scytonema sp. PMC 1069.18]MEC4885647.1 hypothetical protein [Scytonema sp. PMC 1070.18]